MNLVGRLGEQEEAAAEQDQVAAGDLPRIGTANSGSVSLEIQKIDQSSADAHHHRRDETDPAGALLLLLRELARQDRDEDDVVHPENDLEERSG